MWCTGLVTQGVVSTMLCVVRRGCERLHCLASSISTSRSIGCCVSAVTGDGFLQRAQLQRIHTSKVLHSSLRQFLIPSLTL